MGPQPGTSCWFQGSMRKKSQVLPGDMQLSGAANERERRNTLEAEVSSRVLQSRKRLDSCPRQVS